MARLSLWPFLLAGVAAVVFTLVATRDPYATIATILLPGLWVTLRVTIIAFAAALILGTLIAIGMSSGKKLLASALRVYCEIIRGVPMLVLLFYVFFAITPLAVGGINALARLFQSADAGDFLMIRDISFEFRVILALSVGYSAFIAEIVRGGLEAVNKGQIEAGKALGLSGWMRLRHIILPQAFRVMLPPLGNDLIAMLKDSSLVSAVGVLDMTQISRQYTTSNFLYFETYTVLALFYLTLTIGLSICVRSLEHHLKRNERR